MEFVSDVNIGNLSGAIGSTVHCVTLKALNISCSCRYYLVDARFRNALDDPCVCMST